MPVPLIPILLWSVAGGLAGAGAVASVAGVCDMAEAERRVEAARRRHGASVEAFEATRRRTLGQVEALGALRLQVTGRTLRRFAKVMRRFGASVSAKHRQTAHPNLPRLDGQAVATFEQAGNAALVTLKGAAKGTLAGAALSAGVGGGVAAFGTTASGVAIGTLQGAAASNATLALLGGGSLASGGGGMAAGSAVLGGIAVAPVLFIAGLALASHGEKALSAAVAYEADVARKVASVGQLAIVLRAVERRADELFHPTETLAGRLDAVLDRLERLWLWERRQLTPEAEADLAMAWTLVSGLAALVDAPLMDEAG
ncbi:MAG: hypothetical protein VKS61_14550, partial [Candidatus Sericytochromatia bacterium]|nr:hypothetical protein [Candidatus Sericytochromatia bacterium]